MPHTTTKQPTAAHAFELGRNAVDDLHYHKRNPENDIHFVRLADGVTEETRTQFARAWDKGLAHQERIEADLDEKYDR